MTPGVNIIGRKVSIVSANGAWGSGSVLRPQQGSKEHLVWLKIDLNAAEIITGQDHKHKKTNVNGSIHIQC